MTSSYPLTVVNVGYRSTNFWIVSAGRSRLLIDLGWPGLVGTLLANLERKNIPFKEVTHGLATHYHSDHAGAAQDLKLKGMRLIVTEQQVPHIAQMQRWIKPVDNYTPITMHDNVVISTETSCEFLAKLGLPGEIVHTPGHSDDSVTVVLDNGWAFTGDLTSETMISKEDPEVVARSWQSLRDRGVTTIYGGHGGVHSISAGN